MSDDITSLGIKVESSDVRQASADMDRLTRSSKSAETSTESLGSKFLAFGARLATVATAMATINKLVDTARTYQVLESSLQTVTGSAENAAKAMQALQDFAATTPYSVEQATTAYIRLTSLGLEPSRKALISYGNTASAMGKDLIQFVEAVADASVGEFERLKEFGIKARQEGENVSFTFRGVTTTVKKDAEEIQQYLIKIGETDFAGAMELRAKTIDGQLSNLADNWDNLFNTINKAGVGDAMAQAIGVANDAISDLNDTIASGQLQAYMKVVGIQFEGISSDIAYSFNFMKTEVAEAFASMSKDGQVTAKDIEGAFINMPSIIRAQIQETTVDIASYFDVLKAKREEFDRTGKSQDISRAPSDDSSPELRAQLEAIAKARADSVEQIGSERDAAIKATEEQIAAAKKLREEYEAANEARKASTADVLADVANTPKNEKKFTVSSEGKKQLDSVIQQLADEEEQVRNSYERRKEIILKNTQDGSETRNRLMIENEARLNEDLSDLRADELDNITNGLLSEEEQIQASYDRRIELIREATRISEQEKTDLMMEAEIERQDNLAELEERKKSKYESGYGSLYNTQNSFLKKMEQGTKATGVASVAIMTNAFAEISSAGAQQSKAMFELNKAAATANAIVSTYEGAAKAIGQGGIYGAVLAAVVIAAGLAQVAAIQSTSFTGASGSASPSSAGALAGTGLGGTTDTAAIASPQGSATPTGPTINIYGDINSNHAETFLNDVKSLINDSDYVLIDNYSRNGRQLGTV